MMKHVRADRAVTADQLVRQSLRSSLNPAIIKVAKEADFEADVYCRLEAPFCTSKRLHLAHPAIITPKMQHEALRMESKGDPSKHCSIAIQHAICDATSPHSAKVFAAILREVLSHYGSITERTVYRTLIKLRQQGRVLYVQPLDSLPGAYLRPDSRLPKSPDGMRLIIEQIQAAILTDDWTPSRRRKDAIEGST